MRDKSWGEALNWHTMLPRKSARHWILAFTVFQDGRRISPVRQTKGTGSKQARGGRVKAHALWSSCSVKRWRFNWGKDVAFFALLSERCSRSVTERFILFYFVKELASCYILHEITS